jgi:hypothetical protein
LRQRRRQSDGSAGIERVGKVAAYKTKDSDFEELTGKLGARFLPIIFSGLW